MAESGQSGRVAESAVQIGRVWSAERRSPQFFTVQSGSVCRVAASVGHIGSAFCPEAEAIVQSGTVFRAD